jgi:hypothetical protein
MPGRTAAATDHRTSPGKGEDTRTPSHQADRIPARIAVGRTMRYRLIIRGSIPASSLAALEPLASRREERRTELEIEIRDDAHLYGVVELLERAGAGIESLAPMGTGIG